jgi:hypothetical protein
MCVFTDWDGLFEGVAVIDGCWVGLVVEISNQRLEIRELILGKRRCGEEI